jgi:cell wall-associated NlpC family hydrolase
LGNCFGPTRQIKMSGIVTDVGARQSPKTPRSDGRTSVLLSVLGPVLTLVAVCSYTVIPFARPAAADSLSSARAQAAAIEAQINSAGSQISALGQQYDQAEQNVANFNKEVAADQAKIDTDRGIVVKDINVVKDAAISSYVNDGQAAVDNPLFASNQTTLAAQQQYTDAVEGNVTTAMSDLHTAEAVLAQNETQANASKESAEQQAAAAHLEYEKNLSIQDALDSKLSGVKGQISSLVDQAERAEQVREAAAAAARIQAAQNFPAPPGDLSQGEEAVAEAESYLGVPYEWGGASRSGVDCSGLTMLAWDAAGVYLPHYSGAQMADSTPVPLGDLEPGDLLFYGPGGSEHVAMYVSPGTMIEAPETGQYVHLTAIRLGGDFVGAGRP